MTILSATCASCAPVLLPLQATKTILGAIFNGFLLDFPPTFSHLSRPIVDASVEVYNRISVSGRMHCVYAWGCGGLHTHHL